MTSLQQYSDRDKNLTISLRGMPADADQQAPSGRGRSASVFERKLPIELLQEIFSYTCLYDPSYDVDPHFFNPRTTDALLQVSTYWRAAALGYAPLFGCADWVHWSFEKLQLWAERGAAAGLAVSLLNDDRPGAGGIGGGIGNILKPPSPRRLSGERLELVRSVSKHWRALRVRLDESFDHTRLPILLDTPTPRLDSLVILGIRPRVPLPLCYVPPDFAPRLRVFVSSLITLMRGSSPNSSSAVVPFQNVNSLIVDRPANLLSFTLAKTLLVYYGFSLRSSPSNSPLVFSQLERLGVLDGGFDEDEWPGPLAHRQEGKVPPAFPRARLLEIGIENESPLLSCRAWMASVSLSRLSSTYLPAPRSVIVIILTSHSVNSSEKPPTQHPSTSASPAKRLTPSSKPSPTNPPCPPSRASYSPTGLLPPLHSHPPLADSAIVNAQLRRTILSWRRGWTE